MTLISDTIMRTLANDHNVNIGEIESRVSKRFLDIRTSQQLLGAQLSSKETMSDAIARVIIEVFEKYKMFIVNGQSLMTFYENQGWSIVSPAPEASDIEIIIDELIQSEGATLSTYAMSAQNILHRLELKTTNRVVQLDDCYIDGQKIYPGFYDKEPPRFRIGNSAVYDCLYSDAALKKLRVRAVDELIDHLCADEETRTRFLASRAIAFAPDKAIRKTCGRLVYLYGKRGAEGKSVFTDLERRMFGDLNVTEFSGQKIDGYSLPEVANSLVAYDNDSQAIYWEAESVHALKCLVFNEALKGRAIYGKPEDLDPVVSLRIASNHLPKATDKTRALIRRLDVYEAEELLSKPDSWFRELEDNRALVYLCALYIRALNKVFETHSLPEMGKKQQKLLDSIVRENNNIISWVNERGLERIEQWSVKDIRDLYEQWCEESGEIVLGLSNFNKVLSSEYGLERKLIDVHSAKGPRADSALAERKAQIKAWVRI